MGRVFTHGTFNLILITIQWGKVLLDENYGWGNQGSEVRGNLPNTTRPVWVTAGTQAYAVM